MTVSCERVQERLSDYVDGDLGPLAMLATRLHLRYCPGCRSALASLEETLRVLKKCKRGRTEGRPPDEG